MSKENERDYERDGGRDNERDDETDRRLRVEAQFDALAKKSLQNERKGFFRTEGERLRRETLDCEMGDDFTYMPEDEDAADAFAAVDSAFKVLNFDFIVKNGLLYDALDELEKQQRDVVLLKSLLHRVSDEEVGQLLGLETRTVTNIKNNSYRQLKEKITGGQRDGEGNGRSGESDGGSGNGENGGDVGNGGDSRSSRND